MRRRRTGAGGSLAGSRRRRLTAGCGAFRHRPLTSLDALLPLPQGGFCGRRSYTFDLGPSPVSNDQAYLSCYQ
jgi:hypothetical protein